MKKILLVDDDPSTIESISSYLREVGYEVATAANGIEGLEMVKKFEPDLVITDIRMPKLNGVELYFVLKGMKYNKPVIFISSYDLKDAESNNLRITTYIEKPINIFELDGFIKRALLQMDAA